MCYIACRKFPQHTHHVSSCSESCFQATCFQTFFAYTSGSNAQRLRLRLLTENRRSPLARMPRTSYSSNKCNSFTPFARITSVCDFPLCLLCRWKLETRRGIVPHESAQAVLRGWQLSFNHTGQARCPETLPLVVFCSQHLTATEACNSLNNKYD